MDVNNRWITDRSPTFEDADEEGDVYVRFVGSHTSSYTPIAWCNVMVGAHWTHTESWVAPAHLPSGEEWITDRAPTKEDADGEGCVLSMNEDWKTPQYSPWDKVWRQPPWKHTPQWVPASFEDANPSQGE
jgi:hypothetical protein